MPNPANSGRATPSAPLRGAPEAALGPAEASESALLGPGRAAAPPALPPPAQSLRRALADPPASGSAPARQANLRNAVELRPMLGGTAELTFGDGQTIPVARRHTAELGRRLSV